MHELILFINKKNVVNGDRVYMLLTCWKEQLPRLKIDCLTGSQCLLIGLVSDIFQQNP